MRLIISCVAIITGVMLNAGCQQHKEIPDEDLVKIFHDAYLANAYISEQGISEDSLYLYEPIFKRYGYTVEDMQHTLKSFSERKSALLSDLMVEVQKKLEQESKRENRRIVILDTIDNVARRHYTRTIYNDSLIRAKRLRDSSKLHITIGDLVPGEYTVSFDYMIDTLDENRNSRVEVYAITNDGSEVMRSTLMLSRYRESKYSRKLTIDTMHKEIVVNMFYHPINEEAKKPDIKIKNFKVVRVMPTAVSVDSLYQSQLNIRLLNYDMMMGFVGDTIRVSEPSDSIDNHEPQDSIALRTN